MKGQPYSAGWGLLAIALGLDILLTGKGTHYFGPFDRYVLGLSSAYRTGFRAYLEGAFLILAGVYCLAMAWSSKPDEPREP